MNGPLNSQSNGLSPLDRTARVIFVTQACIGLLTASLFYYFGDAAQGTSAGLGFISAFMPNVIFFLVLRRSGGTDSDPGRFMRFFRLGEILKLALTIILLAIVMLVRIPDLKVFAIFIGFALTVLGHWGGMLVVPPVEVKHGS